MKALGVIATAEEAAAAAAAATANAKSAAAAAWAAHTAGMDSKMILLLHEPGRSPLF